jgi:uncharacterized membrane protein
MSGSKASSKGRQSAKPQARQGGQSSGRRSGQTGQQAARGATATGSPNGAGGARNGAGGARNGSRGGQGASRNGASGASATRTGSKRGVALAGADARSARNASAAPVKAGPAAPRTGWRRFLPTPRSMGWLPFTTFVLSVIGLADAGYQVYTHFSNTGLLGCSAKADSCVLVQSSQYAWIFGIPVAVYGAAFFAFMVAICSPWGWRLTQPLVRYARLAAVVIGMIFVLYLIYREVISLGQICEYCTSVHVITFLLFGLIVYEASAPGTAIPPAGTRS